MWIIQNTLEGEKKDGFKQNPDHRTRQSDGQRLVMKREGCIDGHEGGRWEDFIRGGASDWADPLSSFWGSSWHVDGWCSISAARCATSGNPNLLAGRDFGGYLVDFLFTVGKWLALANAMTITAATVATTGSYWTLTVIQTLCNLHVTLHGGRAIIIILFCKQRK